MSSHLDDLSSHQLMAFLFLLEQDKKPDELRALITSRELLISWCHVEEKFKKLVQYYPNEDEEKHYLLATLDAVHGLDPSSDEVLELKFSLKPLITILLNQ